MVAVGYDTQFRIDQSETFAGNGVHINGIEAFRSVTKRRLSKFHSVKRNTLRCTEKACERRYTKSLPGRITNMTLLVSKNEDVVG